MPPPNTPEEGVTAPGSPRGSPQGSPILSISPHPGSAAACPSGPDSAVLEIDYQSLEYVGPVDDTLLCPVCKAPFHSPITTPCGHTFCAGCINRALEVQPTCPIDRQPINKTKDYRRLPLIIKDQLDRLKVKCPNKGCDHECLREHLQGHYERRCEFTLVRCPDSKCTKRIARRDALREKGCLHREVGCQYCGSVVTVAELDAHYDHGCDGANAKCTDCDAAVVRHRLERHKSQDCPEGQTQCKWHAGGCKVADKRRLVQEHEQSGCKFEAIGKVLAQRAEDREILDDLVSRVRALEMRSGRRQHHGERRVGPVQPELPESRAMDVVNFLETPGLNENMTLSTSAASGTGAWGTTEDYMLSQFEVMEAHMEDLRKQMMEMNAIQSLNLLQHTTRVNEQLAELASKLGVLNMHTAWLLNMYRQNQALQRAASIATGALNSGSAPASDTDATRGGSSSESETRNQGDSRRNSNSRGVNPPRL